MSYIQDKHCIMKPMFLRRSTWVLLAAIAGSMAHAAPIICQLNDGVDPVAVAATYGINFVEQAPHGPFFLFDADPEQIEAIEHAMSTDGQIVWSDTEEDLGIAEADITSKAGTLGVVGDPIAIYAQNFNLFGQVRWTPSLGLFTSQVNVAILDTGLSPYATTIWPHVINAEDQLTGSAQAYDLPSVLFPEDDIRNFGAGHGTFVAGIIQTMAPNTGLIIEKVADSAGHATVWAIVRGVSDAVHHGAKIINISLGTYAESKAMEKIFEWSRNHGVLSVAPVGNDGTNSCLYPAKLDGVLCVTGVDGNDHKAPFSNWHNQADFAAPATGLKSVYWDGNLAIWSGTSFAAPQVTSALALAIGRGSKKSNSVLVNWLESVGVGIDGANAPYATHLGKRVDFGAIKLIHRSGNKQTDRATAE